MGDYSVSIRDRSRELSNVRINIGTVTGATLPGYLTTTGALRAAIEGISTGVAAKDEMKVFSNKLSNAVPASPFAQREIKWLVRYSDDTEFFDAPTNSIHNEGYGLIHNLEIPCANLGLTDVLQANSDFADLTHPAMAAFVDAFEAVALSPANGAVKVVSIEFVGRNL